MKIATRRQAMAIYWGCDVSDVNDCIYHPTRTSIPVYTSAENYFCVTKKNEKPATHRDGFDWDWKKQTDALIESNDWQIWKA